jgi:Fe-S oxidoreductase
MRAQYAAEGVNLRTEIVSLADVLAPAAQNLACPVKPKPVYYHDPCYNARYNNVVEQPRRALAQLAEVRELSWNKSDTECCGGGGLLPKTMPLVADQMAKRRLAEVQAAGGGLVVTSCATCTFMLKRNAPPSVEVANLATAMAQLSETAYTPPPSSPLDDDA